MKLLAPVVLVLAAACPISALEGEDPATREIIDRYVAYVEKQQPTAMRGVQMDVNIDARVPKLQKSGGMQALRVVTRLGRIVYQTPRFFGDNTIKKEVINRYLTAENEAKDVAQLAVTPANYKFKYKGMAAHEDHLVHVFQLSPRKKSVGLYKGELWLDAQTCVPVKEFGRFVKNPSIFVKKWEFVRDYEIRDGVSIPRHIESTIDTRLWGPAEMSINYSNFARTEGDAGPTASNSQGNQ